MGRSGPRGHSRQLVQWLRRGWSSESDPQASTLHPPGRLGVPAAVRGGRLGHSRVPGDGGYPACILDIKGSLHSLILGRWVK